VTDTSLKEITILTIDQLPESRRAILTALKQQGCATIAKLAEKLQLTGEAVRQQLLQLQRGGWIEPKVTRGLERLRTGRPATSYILTETGDHLFPKHYDALNVALIDAIAEEFGPEATVRVLRRVAAEKVAANEPVTRGLSLDQRVAALHDWYLDSDPYMETEEVEGGYRLIERNCPFFNTAMHRPALCSVTVNALTQLLGVRVRREEKFQNGDGRCVFRVYANEPVDSAKWEFRLESDLSS
jgi:predicted ArsR family transcriptional regulator